MFIGVIIGVAVRPAAELIVGCLAYTVRVTNYARILRLVFILLVAWLKVFLTLSHLTYTLI